MPDARASSMAADMALESVTKYGIMENLSEEESEVLRSAAAFPPTVSIAFPDASYMASFACKISSIEMPFERRAEIISAFFAAVSSLSP